MKFDEINKLTDAQLEEQKLYYENRKAGFKEYHDKYMFADSVLYDIKEEIQNRQLNDEVGQCFQSERGEEYLCVIRHECAGLIGYRQIPVCMIIEKDTDYDSYTLYIGRVQNLGRYKKIPKEEFLKQYATAVNHLLNNINPHMSMTLNKEDTNGND